MMSFRFRRAVLALACGAWLAQGLLAPWGAAYAQQAQQPTTPRNTAALPALGDPASADLSPSAERRLGERAMREIRQDPDYLSDPTLTDYLNRVGARIAAHMSLYAEAGAPTSTELFAVRDKSINAFAMPGGFIGVNTGLLIAAHSESELAGVLGHETGHVAQRHIARSIAKDSQSGMLSMASILLALLAARNSPDAAQAALMFGQGAAVQSQLNYSRDNEREADRVGLQLLGDAGYPPRAMVTFFERLQRASRLSDSGAFPYLRTHPLTTERIGDLDARVAKLSEAEPFSAEFAMMQGRARVLSETTLDGLRELRQACHATGNALANGGPNARPVSLTQRISAQYCEVGAATGLRDWGDAQAALAQLTQTLRPYMKQAPVARELAMLSAELQLAQDRGAEALAMLQPLQAAEPGNRPLLMLLAQAALRGGQPDTAREALQGWVTLHRHDGAAWRLLGQAYNMQHQDAAALRANAESLIVDEQWQAAAEMLERARRVPGTDYFDASIIDARLHEVKDRIKQEMRDNAGRRPPSS